MERLAPGALLRSENDVPRCLRIVAPKHRWNILDADVLRWIASAPPDRRFCVELLERRTMVEPVATRLAAQRASHETITAIECAYHARASALAADLEARVRNDLMFPEPIISATGNRLLRALASAIRMALVSAFRVSTNARQSYENSLADHRAVAVAIRNRAAEQAGQAMCTLLAGTARDLAPAFAPQARLTRGARPRR